MLATPEIKASSTAEVTPSAAVIGRAGLCTPQTDSSVTTDRSSDKILEILKGGDDKASDIVEHSGTSSTEASDTILDIKVEEIRPEHQREDSSSTAESPGETILVVSSGDKAHDTAEHKVKGKEGSKVIADDNIFGFEAEVVKNACGGAVFCLLVLIACVTGFQLSINASNRIGINKAYVALTITGLFCLCCGSGCLVMNPQALGERWVKRKDELGWKLDAGLEVNRDCSDLGLQLARAAGCILSVAALLMFLHSTTMDPGVEDATTKAEHHKSGLPLRTSIAISLMPLSVVAFLLFKIFEINNFSLDMVVGVTCLEVILATSDLSSDVVWCLSEEFASAQIMVGAFLATFSVGVLQTALFAVPVEGQAAPPCIIAGKEVRDEVHGAFSKALRFVWMGLAFFDKFRGSVLLRLQQLRSDPLHMCCKRSDTLEKAIANVSACLWWTVYIVIGPPLGAVLFIVAIIVACISTFFLALAYSLCMMLTCLFLVLSLMCVFCLGVFLVSTRLLVVTSVLKWYASCLGKSEADIKCYIVGEVPIAIGFWHRSILLELVFESFPSIVINITNMILLRTMSVIGVTALAFSVYMLSRTAYKYMYQMYGERKSLNEVSFHLVMAKPQAEVAVTIAAAEYASGVATSS